MEPWSGLVKWTTVCKPFRLVTLFLTSETWTDPLSTSQGLWLVDPFMDRKTPPYIQSSNFKISLSPWPFYEACLWLVILTTSQRWVRTTCTRSKSCTFFWIPTLLTCGALRLSYSYLGGHRSLSYSYIARSLFSLHKCESDSSGLVKLKQKALVAWSILCPTHFCWRPQSHWHCTME